MNTRPAVLGLAVLAVAAGGSAQVEPLFAPPIHPSVVNIRGATPGDVNGDGLPDLVVWAFGPSVMLNLGNGGFAPPVTVGAPGQAVSVHLDDLDHDGVLDMLALNAFDDALKVALGNGDGTFAAFVDYTTAGDPREIELADFNGDGHMDVAAAGLNTSRVAVNLGNGDGTFAPKVDYGPIGDYAQAVTAADLTGDGLPDLAISSGNDDQVSLLYNDGDGTFTSVPPVILSSGVEDVGAIDLDDDGDLDLVISMVSGNVLRVVFNLGQGVFSHSNFPFPLPSGVNSSLVVADFDEDGRDDVALGIGADDLVVVYRSTGLTDASALQMQGTYIAGNNPQGLACADMDLDGDLDLIAANFSGNDVRILRGEGDGGFRTSASSWAVGSQPTGVATGDFNEDGRIDVVTSGTGNALGVMLNAGNGHFPTATAWPVSAGTRSDALVADFNGDGHADVAAANSSFASGGATIVLGAGNGQSLANKTFVAFGTWTWIDAADFDADNDLDLVLGRGDTSGPSSVQVVLNDGAGNLSAGPMLDTKLFTARGVCAADFDNDGDPDIVVADGSGSIPVFLGDGAGGFSAPVYSTAQSGWRDVAAADFDGDGNLDLAATDYGLNVFVHAGLGDGTFGNASLYGLLNNASGLAIGDLDHDGIVDIATANNHQFGLFGSLGVLIGNGDGTFQPAATFRTGQSPWQVAIADLDGDGWNDLVTAAESGTDVMLNRRGPWNELGHGLAGTQGIPRQTGTGTMVPGQPFKFTLKDGRPFTTAYHVVGLSPLMHAFKGGTMVPAIDFINIFPVTNAQGTVVLAGPWINVPAGLTLYFQFWLPDPNGPLNFAASTAISATTN